jgi:steroid delta-isomerase-like uncharacterized protein
MLLPGVDPYTASMAIGISGLGSGNGSRRKSGAGHPDEEHTMYAEGNKAVCRRFIQTVFNQGDLSLVRDFVAPDAINHEVQDAFGESRPRPGRSPEWMADLAYLYRRAFPDLRFEVLGQISEGDRVVTQLRMRGTQERPLMAIPASGRTVDVPGLRIDRFDGGKIVESWFYLDSLTLLRQLGVSAEQAKAPQVAAPAFRQTRPGLPVAPWTPTVWLSQVAANG